MNNKYVKCLIDRYPQLKCCGPSIQDSIDLLINTFENGNKIFVCGNGGSFCDSMHIVGELMKGFIKQRPVSEGLKNKSKELFGEDGVFLTNYLQSSLPAIALGCQTGLSSAYINDVQPELVYAQELYGLASEGDTLISISTSGNSNNVYYAVLIAKLLGIKVILLSGKTEGKINHVTDIVINVPETETYKIQELHLPIYHTICIALEEKFYG